MKRRDFLNAGLALGAAAIVENQLEANEMNIDAAPGESISGGSFKKIRIGQIGVRHEHASGKMNTLKMLPQYYEIVGIAAESPEWEKKHRNDGVYKGVKWMSKEELLNQPGLEAIAVETEMTELLPTTVECAKRGLHLHVDKPLGQDLNECKQMLDVCRDHNVIMQPGYMFRTNQAIRLAIKAVQKGWLGEIHDVSANMNRNDTSPGFRKWLATYRGGGMYDFGSHLVDFVVEMLGAPDEIKVIEKPDPKDNLSDNTLSLLLYAKAIAELRVTLRRVDGFKTRCLSVSGTKGSFFLDPLEKWERDPKTGKMIPLNVRLTLTESNEEYKAGTHELKIMPFTDRYIGQLTDLAMFIRGLKKNPYSYDHELLVQKTILAASGYIPWKK